MPRISFFYGIAVYMYFRDHAPPHFHAMYGEHEGVFDLQSIELMAGRLPNRAHSLVAEWARIRQDELRANWERAQAGEPLVGIAPLD